MDKYGVERTGLSWLRADSDLRAVVTLSAHQIDVDLRTNPKEVGESRVDDERIYFVGPLGLLFQVEQDELKVVVGHVWLFQMKSK